MIFIKSLKIKRFSFLFNKIYKLGYSSFCGVRFNFIKSLLKKNYK